MKWTTKARIQRLLSPAPGFYAFAQHYFGALSRYSAKGKIRNAKRLLAGLKSLDLDLAGKVSVEIGTGWCPVLPFIFFLEGQERCHSYDITRLLSRKLSPIAVREVLAAGFGERFPERREALARAADPPAASHIDYRAPADASRSGLPDASVDFVFSNTVLEHIRPEDIGPLFAEARRILKPGGFMLHLIDTSDHYSHSDKSISGVNFLQYSEAAFARYQTRYLYQNRIRLPAWREIVEKEGFRVGLWQTNWNPGVEKALPSLKLDPAFRRFATTDLCATSVVGIAFKD